MHGRMPEPLRVRDDGRFNPPAVVAARLVFLFQLFGWIAGTILLVLALGEVNWARAGQAGIVFGLSFGGREWLRRKGRLKECADSFDTMFVESGGAERLDTHGDDTAAERLSALVERRIWLEGHRGAPGFDPWELQQVRHDITDHMKKFQESADAVRDEGTSSR